MRPITGPRGPGRPPGQGVAPAARRVVLLDAAVRLLPGVLGCEASAPDDSFASGLLEHPQYTRQWELRGVAVPAILGSGDHDAIRRWRREESLRLTLARRPDLLAFATLDPSDIMLPTLRTGGRGNAAGYSNAAVDRLLDDAELAARARESLRREAADALVGTRPVTARTAPLAAPRPAW